MRVCVCLCVCAHVEKKEKGNTHTPFYALVGKSVVVATKTHVTLGYALEKGTVHGNELPVCVEKKRVLHFVVVV